MTALPTRRDRENERYAALREEFDTERAYWKEGYEHDQQRIAELLSDRDQAEARAEQAEADLATVRDTLEHRSDALNRAGASNDQLRATLARVEKAANELGSNLEPTEYARGQRRACTVIRYALADQEPASE